MIEHFDPPRLRAVEENVFGTARPKTVVVTTPNAEYNHLWPSLEGFRHTDHRFEWTRAEFAAWAAQSPRPTTATRPLRAGRPGGPRGRPTHADGGVRAMKIELGDPCLVVLIGASGSGKSTFAARHFLPTETVSSDFCRALVADDPNDQAATKDAFAVLHEIASRRLARGRLTVIDATNVQKEAREPLVRIAREHDLFAAAIVIDTPEATCQERNATRPDRAFGAARHPPPDA